MHAFSAASQSMESSQPGCFTGESNEDEATDTRASSKRRRSGLSQPDAVYYGDRQKKLHNFLYLCLSEYNVESVDFARAQGYMFRLKNGCQDHDVTGLEKEIISLLQSSWDAMQLLAMLANRGLPTPALVDLLRGEHDRVDLYAAFSPKEGEEEELAWVKAMLAPWMRTRVLKVDLLREQFEVSEEVIADSNIECFVNSDFQELKRGFFFLAYPTQDTSCPASLFSDVSCWETSSLSVKSFLLAMALQVNGLADMAYIVGLTCGLINTLGKEWLQYELRCATPHRGEKKHYICSPLIWHALKSGWKSEGISTIVPVHNKGRGALVQVGVDGTAFVRNMKDGDCRNSGTLGLVIFKSPGIFRETDKAYYAVRMYQTPDSANSNRRIYSGRVALAKYMALDTAMSGHSSWPAEQGTIRIHRTLLSTHVDITEVLKTAPKTPPAEAGFEPCGFFRYCVVDPRERMAFPSNVAL